jgi:hypothetical protein
MSNYTFEDKEGNLIDFTIDEALSLTITVNKNSPNKETFHVASDDLFTFIAFLLNEVGITNSDPYYFQRYFHYLKGRHEDPHIGFAEPILRENTRWEFSYNARQYLFHESIHAIRTKAEAEVFIGLPQEQIDLFAIENIQNACGEFMEAMGFEMEAKDEPVFGSFFQRLKFVLTSEKTAKEVNDIYQKGKHALEAQQLDLPRAEASEKLANAAAKAIESIQLMDEAVLRLGALLVVKVQKEGKPVILVETISPQMSATLDVNPVILNSPAAIYEILLASKKYKGQIGEGEGMYAV